MLIGAHGAYIADTIISSQMTRSSQFVFSSSRGDDGGGDAV